MENAIRYNEDDDWFSGLSIVKAVAEAHHGSAVAEALVPAGLRLVVSLPAASSRQVDTA